LRTYCWSKYNTNSQQLKLIKLSPNPRSREGPRQHFAFAFFLLNRKEISILSLTHSLKVHFRHRNIIIIPKQPELPPAAKSSTGILTSFPFNSIKAFIKINPLHFLSYLTNLLGSTNSDRNALHLKPFSTSAQIVLIFVITTTTKICTNDSSTPFHNKASSKSSRSSTHEFKTIFNTHG